MKQGPKQGYARFCIHELFEQQVRKTPDRTALLRWDERVTFAELNRRANQYAHALRSRGVGSEAFVGLCLERSIEAIAALIGILKAGGAYVYLDPSYPPHRLREMARDSGLSLVITNADLQNRILAHCPEIAVLTPRSDEIRRQEGGEINSPVSLDHAAYVIYTSGSTGRPKGAVEIHRSMISRLISVPLPDIQPTDVCSLNSSLSFGITASRLSFPLVQGAPVVVLDDKEVKDVIRFAQCLDAHEVTSVFMAPPLLRRVLLLREEGACHLRSLRAVTVTGATLTPDLIARFQRLLPGAQLIDVYGSTETGTTAAMRVHGASTSGAPGSIGKAVANTRIYVLDHRLRPVRPGVTGEICVASRHLAREYLHQPALTAQRFLANPFGKPGDRICRTGDLGLRLPNGEIQFRGRADYQVKIRGYRVELGEIEVALLDHESVREAVVTAPGPDDERRLVAYLVGKDGIAPDIAGLKKFLVERLPEYMLPSAFVTLSELPLTDAGKVDRSALPEPGRADAVAPDGMPETEAEKTIARLFTELLRIEQISVHDNFVELGGDSLALTQLLMAIRTHLGRDLPARLVFEASVGEIAREASDPTWRSPVTFAAAPRTSM